MKLSALAPEWVRALVRKERFARRNARFEPRIVRKTIDGTAFDFLLGDAIGQDWYAGQNTMSIEMAFLRDRLTRPGDVVLECGAHHGFTTILLANWIGPTGRLTAFEASPSSAMILRENIAHNDLAGRVTVEAKAVGSRRGSLSVTDESNSVPLTGRMSRGVSVPVVPLDDYADLEATLVKLDVEGFEIEALQGATRVLERKPKLAIEVHVDMLRRYGHSADELFELVRPRDYEFWLQLGPDSAPRPFAGERLSDQHIDQVHLYGLPKS
jgi:FkbM family methyltransferase